MIRFMYVHQQPLYGGGVARFVLNIISFFGVEISN